MKYIFTYKTINLVNNKVYIGVHSTTNLNDGYLGSGYKLQDAIKKYGKQYFEMNPIQFFNSIEEAYQHEAELVNENWVQSNGNYNTALGGFGGFYHIDTKGENNPNYGKRWNDEWKTAQRERMREYYKNNPAPRKGATHSDESKEKMSKSKTEFYKEHPSPMKGTIMSVETKRKISQSRKGCGVKPVIQYTKENEFIKRWDSIISAATFLKIHSASISICVNGKSKTSGGYIWKYADS